MSIEADVDEPHESAIFANYSSILDNPDIVEFITDYLRLMVSGNLNSFELENLMDNEIETHHHEGEIPCTASRSWETACRPSALSRR